MSKKKTPPLGEGAARKNTPLLFLVLLALPMYGGYYNFLTCLMGAVLAVLLVFETLRRGSFCLPRGPEVWLLAGLTLCSLLSLPFAVSAGMAFVGFLRTGVWLLFYLYAATYTPTERREILDVAAYEGSILSALSVVAYLWDAAHGVENANGRIDGFFEYANTYGLFLLICLVLILFKEKRRRVDYAAMLCLALGIFLSGSRGIFLLLAAVAIGAAVWQVARRGKLLPVALGAGGAVLAGGVAVLTSGGMVLSRLQAISLSSSSLNGRLLYDLDGLSMILAHPMGVGRGGYLYLQPVYQTGVYTLKFIHNEYLQAALDGGAVAGVLLLALMAVLLFRRGAAVRERAVIFAVAAHCVIDFDLQFTAVVFLLLLCAGFKNERAYAVKRRPPTLAVGAVICLVMSYAAVGYFFDYTGNAAAAYTMLPWDLSLAENRLQSCETMEEAVTVADQITERTELSMLAWDCKYAYAVQQGSALDMARAKYQYLRLNKYRGEVYESLASVLENGAAQCSQEELTEYKALAASAATLLEEVNRETSPLAYRIVDRPDLSFTEDILARLRSIE